MLKSAKLLPEKISDVKIDSGQKNERLKYSDYYKKYMYIVSDDKGNLTWNEIEDVSYYAVYKIVGTQYKLLSKTEKNSYQAERYMVYAVRPFNVKDLINNKKPTAVISMSPNEKLDTTSKISFDFSNSKDDDGDKIVDFEWQNLKDSYTEGNNSVKLRVMDENNEWSDWVEKSFNIEDLNKLSKTPTAVITMSPSDKITTRTKVTFDYSKSTDSNGLKIVDTEWVGKKPIYTKTGEYTVSLKVKNEKGVWSQTSTITFSVVK